MKAENKITLGYTIQQLLLCTSRSYVITHFSLRFTYSLYSFLTLKLPYTQNQLALVEEGEEEEEEKDTEEEEREKKDEKKEKYKKEKAKKKKKKKKKEEKKKKKKKMRHTYKIQREFPEICEGTKIERKRERETERLEHENSDTQRETDKNR